MGLYKSNVNSMPHSQILRSPRRMRIYKAVEAQGFSSENLQFHNNPTTAMWSETLLFDEPGSATAMTNW